ncbi:MAG: hypothetical protein ACPIOQ_41845, partial [Promethearchaeia archaeon]
VFTYYSHIGYLCETGGRARATNGNNSYGTYGSVAEGVDPDETAVTAVVDNISQYNATIGNVFTNTDELQRMEFDHAGNDYTEAVFDIFGAGDDDADGWRLWLRWGSDPSFAPCADSASNLLCSSCVSFESTCAWRHLCYSCCDSCGSLRMCVPICLCLRACTRKISHAKHRDIHSDKPARLHACIRARPHLDQKERVHT